MKRVENISTRTSFARLAWLIGQLQQRRGQVITISGLASDYQVSRKTIDRDFELLRQIGCLETLGSRDGLRVLGLLVKKVSCPFCSKHHRL